MEEIRPGLFRIEIPLLNNPLKYLNSYVLVSRDRHLVVDTGLNREECLAAMEAGLKELGLDRSRCDFFITHLHTDHIGLVGKLITPQSRVFLSQPDWSDVLDREKWDRFVETARANGFPEHEIRQTLSLHPGYLNTPEHIPDITVIKDGDLFSIGAFRFRCLATPGHSSGHMCLYDQDEKILISGDHILGDITPNIQSWRENQNCLEDYLNSLDKVTALEVELVLPGHRRLVHDLKRRVGELKAHHCERADETLALINNGGKTAYEVAGGMKWDIRCDSWDDFPVAQKWFAMGEAMAHLRYLEGRGRACRRVANGLVTFFRCQFVRIVLACAPASRNKPVARPPASAARATNRRNRTGYRVNCFFMVSVPHFPESHPIRQAVTFGCPPGSRASFRSTPPIAAG